MSTKNRFIVVEIDYKGVKQIAASKEPTALSNLDELADTYVACIDTWKNQVISGTYTGAPVRQGYYLCLLDLYRQQAKYVRRCGFYEYQNITTIHAE